MDLIRLPLADIKPAPYNPRTIPDEEFARLITSLETFGYVDPMIVNVRDNRNIVVGGNQRLEALKALDFCEVEVVAVDLSIPEEMALNLALNKISGRWDYGKLSTVFEELQIADFDTALTGFSENEITGLLSEPIDIDGYLSEHKKEPKSPDVVGEVDSRRREESDPGGEESRFVTCPNCGTEVEC